MGEAGVIDLGDLRQPPTPRVDPGRAPYRRRAGLLLGVALLAASGGAAPVPAPRPPTVIPAAHRDTTLLMEDRYYVVTPGEARGERSLSAYQLPQARLLTRFALRVPGVVVRVEASGDVLVVASREAGNLTTTGVDARTGRNRWQRAAALVGLSRSGRAAVLVDVSGSGPDRLWQAVDPATGRVRWSYLVRSGEIVHVPWQEGPTDMLLVMQPSGRVQVRETETGAVTVSAALGPLDRPKLGVGIWTANGLLLLGGEVGITAYALDRLDRRWHSTVRLPGGFVHPFCGDLICFVEPTTGMRVLDPATGRVRWSTDQWSASARTGRYLFADAVRAPEEPSAHVVLDARTGRSYGNLGKWQPLVGLLGDRVIAVRPASDEIGRTWFGLIDPATLDVRVLGVAEQVAGRCEIAPAALLCRRVDGSVGVWRLPAR